MTRTHYKKAGWINRTNVYEVNLRQYTAAGSFDAFAGELPRLKDMGVETLWFMPLTPISVMNRKGRLGSYYACSDYCAISEEFGTAAAFKSLVELAHSLEFKVIIDWVANHTGWDHRWTRSDPGFYKRDAHTGDFKIASGMDDIIELDFNNPALRTAMISAMEYWVREFDIDGFRCDLAFWVDVNFWKEARAYLEQVKTLFWLAETDAIEHPEFASVFDATYTWQWMHKTKAFYEGRTGMEELKQVLEQYHAISTKDHLLLWFTSNHDENSWNGTEYEKYGDMAELLAVFGFTWPGIPLIYSGQELPNRKRLEFFEKDLIAWDGQFRLHDLFKTLLMLRRENPAFRTGDDAAIIRMLQVNAGEKGLSFLRKNGAAEVLVFLNFSSELLEVRIGDTDIGGKYRDIFTQEQLDLGADSRFLLDPWGYRVLEK